MVAGRRNEQVWIVRYHGVNPCFETVFGGRSPQKLRNQTLGVADRLTRDFAPQCTGDTLDSPAFCPILYFFLRCSFTNSLRELAPVSSSTVPRCASPRKSGRKSSP